MDERIAQIRQRVERMIQLDGDKTYVTQHKEDFEWLLAQIKPLETRVRELELRIELFKKAFTSLMEK